MPSDDVDPHPDLTPSAEVAADDAPLVQDEVAADDAPLVLDELPSDTAPAKRRSGRRIIVGTLAGLALIGAAIITVSVVAGGSGGGSRTPEQAVHAFVSAVEDEDLIGLLETIDPLERDALRAALEGAQGEGERLDLLADTFSLEGVEGIDLSVQELQLETEELAPDVAVVHATDGEIVVQFDKDLLPVGSAIGDIGDGRGQHRFELTRYVEEGDTDVFLATVERDGDWYISVAYTLVEYLRRASDLEAPEPNSGAAPTGSATPEEAATALVERLVVHDWNGIGALASPGEGDALTRYAPLIAEAWEDSGLDGEGSPGTADLVDVQWEVTQDGNRAVAQPVAYTIEGTMPEWYGSGEDQLPAFDPTKPTVLSGEFTAASSTPPDVLVIPAGEPVPETVDVETAELTPWEEAPFDANVGMIDEDGSVTPYWSDNDEAPASADDALTYRVEYASGCTTYTGAAFEDSTNDVYLELSNGTVTPVEGGYRMCDATRDPVFALYGVFGLLGGADALPASVSLVQVDGQWYVSPLGTLTGTVVDGLRAAESSGFDGPLAFWLYGETRQGFENLFRDASRDGLSEACTAISEFDERGVFVRIIDAPSPVLARQCYDDAWGDDVSSSGEDVDSDEGYATATTRVPVPESTSVPATSGG